MFVTVDEVLQITGYTVTNPEIRIAQGIVEAFIGRSEAQIDDAGDNALLEKAVAYQVAYMNGDAAKVFEQVDATQIQQFGQMISFSNDGTSPFIAPLTKLACKKLSWLRAKSIRTGGIFDTGTAGVSSYAEAWRRDLV